MTLRRISLLVSLPHARFIKSVSLVVVFFLSKFIQALTYYIIGVWRNRNDARLGGQGPWHTKARAAGRTFYDNIIFKTLKLTIEDDAKSWSFSDWTSEDEKA